MIFSSNIKFIRVNSTESDPRMWKKIQSDKEIPFQFRIFKSGIPDSVPPLDSILEMAMHN